MEKELKPLSHACKRLGFTKQSVLNIIAKDPRFPAVRVGESGHWRVDPADLEEWIARQVQARLDRFRERTKEAGAYYQSDADVTKNAALDLRYIAVTGTAPPHSAHWRNAKFAKGDVPPDIAAALDLAPTASFEIAVEAAARLLALPSAKRAEAFKAVAGRLAAFHSAEEV